MGEFQSKKLSDCLTGVKVSQTWPEESALTRHDDVGNLPTYLVKLALIELHGQHLPVGGEKRGWELPLTFDDRVWLIVDWKGATLQILGDKEASASAHSLFRKLKTAATIVGNRVKKNAKVKRETDCISLRNGYGHLSYLYRFFRSASEAAMSDSVTQSVATSEPTDLDAVVDQFNIDLGAMSNRSNRIQANASAAIVVFFAALEAVLDAAFSLGNRQGRTFGEYRKLELLKRFGMWFDIQQGSASKTYEQVFHIWREYRHAIAHFSPVFFFPLPGCGLVPVDYKDLFLPRATPHALRDPGEVTRIFNVFDATLDLFRSSDPTKFALLYCEYDLPIHIDQRLAEDIKRHMGSIEEFKREAEWRCGRQDEFDNTGK